MHIILRDDYMKTLQSLHALLI